MHRLRKMGRPMTSSVPSESRLASTEAEAHAEAFQKCREARRTELMEDYVELIADLIEHSGEARQIDIAQRLGVTQPTVAKMLRRLADENLVTQRRYRGVFLTEEGRELAAASRRRHEIVEAFLCRLGRRSRTQPGRMPRASNTMSAKGRSMRSSVS